ncbi:6-phosphogluconolactonase [Lentilactobacillus sunkii]|uniref:6-phosphogluconolactonase n=1 Tax=Lentilactobacillus sunkii TaxID=481719 RepID=A0A1E7XIX4_9LACO|nr:lactonase family protein [Lentilactobacillus sunkii]OFA13064.1 6-phosphogluconolactonase [Lentilactobacillus sunkii]
MKEKLIFGTYSSRISKGIYQAEFDTDSGKMGAVHLSAEIGAPTYLALSDANVIYAVNQDVDKGGVSVYYLSGNQLNKLADHLFNASSPVNITINEERQLVFASNYNNGFVQIFKIMSNGDLSLVDEIHNLGQGVLPQQSTSHLHYAQLTPDGRLCMTDLGTDEILIFDLSSDGHVLQKATTFHTRPGFGPKKIIFTTNGENAYVLGELANQVILLKYHPKSGTFDQLQSISTLPDNWVGENGCGAMYLSKDEKYLYVSNRGHNSVSVFSVDETNCQLEMIQSISSEGDFPREICLDQSERYVIVGNQKSDSVAIYQRDSKSGRLTLLSINHDVPEPVCIICTNDIQ